jgi:hypothetical protein
VARNKFGGIMVYTHTREIEPCSGFHLVIRLDILSEYSRHVPTGGCAMIYLEGGAPASLIPGILVRVGVVSLPCAAGHSTASYK